MSDPILSAETMTKWRDGYEVKGWTQRTAVLFVYDSHEALRERVATLEAALREYAHHNGACRYSGMHWAPGMEGGNCTCGLDAALGEQNTHAEPDQCPTCGSDNPSTMVTGTMANPPPAAEPDGRA